MEEKIIEDKLPINITKHVLERFTERTMGYTEQQEISLYINSNLDLVTERIRKLFSYSELFYEGVLRDKSYGKFYLNRAGWVMITDKAEKQMITLYKIDLHAGAELNANFIEAMVAKINGVKEELATCTIARDAENSKMREKIANNDITIKEYNRLLKELKEENENIRNYISTNQSNVSTKENELKECVEHLISWKVF